MVLLLSTSFGIQMYKTGMIRRGVEPIWDDEYKFYTDSLDGDIHVTLFGMRKSKRIKIGEGVFNLSGITKDRESVWLNIMFEDPEMEKAENVYFKVHLGLMYISEDDKKVKQKYFRDGYTLGSALGEGATAVVFKAVRRDDKAVFAVKRLDKRTMDARTLRKFSSEIEILSKLKSPYIIELFETFYEEEYVYMVQELAPYGELFDFVADKQFLSEVDAASVIMQILKGIKYLHNRGIAHRDLKLENILVTSIEPLTVKIIDFGLSKNFSTEILQTACGTPEYVAPEVLMSAPYDQSADIWSIGVITFMILSGKPPFYGADNHEIFTRILRVDFHYIGKVWRGVSRSAKNFIEALLEPDPDMRPSADKCLQAPWFSKMNSQRRRNSLGGNPLYHSIENIFA
eukprot:TRINITY_DN847_c0_g1_i2.p2 TRINITY_DN847_c0_g1~~TRINITY_DN847_c0_g1_i2.p2  ORF type:complete len:400 (-),score=83.14 TRINITY_DN847_c0_g1_i2:1814-3013(-)